MNKSNIKKRESTFDILPKNLEFSNICHSLRPDNAGFWRLQCMSPIKHV